MMGQGTETYLRVGVDGTRAQDGSRIVTRSLDDISRSAQSSTSNVGMLQSAMDGLGGAASRLSVMVAGVAAAFATWKLKELLQDSTLLAARVETLGVVMQQTGKNLLYTNSQMEGYAKGVAAMGITTEASRQSVIRMVQANLDLKESQNLARIAQNAAVIANTNSSDAFDRMILGMSTGQAIILHHMGLMVNFEKGYQELAASLGKTAAELSEEEKAHARVIEVKKSAVNINGAYEASMGTAGKQIQSMKRYTEELKLALGQVFLPELTAAVFAVSDGLKFMQGHVSEIKSAAGALVAIGLTVFFARTAAAVYDAGRAQVIYAAQMLQGNVVTLGSAQANLQRAAAQVESTQAALAAVTASAQEAIATQASAAAYREYVIAVGLASASAETRAAAHWELIALDAQLLAAETQITAAIAAESAAQGSAAVASIAHAEAMNAATFSSRALAVAQSMVTGVIGGMKAALALVGGEIGLIIIAIGALTYAWEKFKDRQASVNREIAENGAGSVRSKLMKENEELAAMIKSQTETPSQKIEEAATKAQTDLNNLKKQELSLQQQIVATQKSGDTRRLQVLEAQLKSNKLDQAFVPQLAEQQKKLLEQQAKLQQKAPSGGPADNSEAERQAAYDRSVWDATRALDLQHSKEKIALAEVTSKEQLDILKQQFDQGLVTEQDMLNRQYELERSSAMNRLKLLNAEAHTAYQAYSKTSDNPNTDRLQQLQDETKYDAAAAAAERAAREIDAMDTLQPGKRQALFQQQSASLSSVNGQLLEAQGSYRKAAEAKAAFEQSSPEFLRLPEELKLQKKALGELVIEEGKRKDISISTASTLSDLANQLTRLNSLESSYQLTVEQAATGRLSIYEAERTALQSRYNAESGASEASRQVQEQLRQSIEQTSAKIVEQQKILGDRTAIGGAQSALYEYAKTATDAGAQIKNAMLNAFQSIEQALTNMITKGKGDFHSLLSSLGTDIAGMLVKQNITGPITSFLGQAVSGQGTSGLSGMFSTGSMFFSNLTEGVKAGASTGILSGFKEGFSTMISGGSTNFAGGLGMMLPAMGTAGIAAYAANSYFGPGGLWNKGNDEQKAWRGAAMTNPLGWSALGLDWATGGGLFGTNWDSKGQGVNIVVEGGSIRGSSFTDQSREGSFWSGTQNRSIISSLDPKWDAFIKEQFGTISDTLIKDGKILGDSTVAQTLKNFTSAASHIKLDGLSGADQQKAIQTYFQNLTNEAISKLYPEIAKFTKVGEDASSAFNRITSSLQAVNEAATITGNRTLSTSLSGGNDASGIVTALGGASNLLSAIDKYSQVVNTDGNYSTIKAASDHRSIAAALADQNVQIPQTISEYKNLVEAQDLSTQSGRDLYAILLQLAPTFADLKNLSESADTALTTLKDNQSKLDQDTPGRLMVAQGQGYSAQLYKLQIEQENELADARKKGLDVTKLLITQQEEYAKAVSDIYKTAASEAISVQENLLQGLTGILQSNASPLQKYEADKSAYESTKALALQGDKQALSDLTSKITTMLASSSAYNASSSQFQVDKADAVATLASLAGLGTTSPTLEAAQNQLSTLQAIHTALGDGNKAQVEYLKGLLGNTGIVAQYLTGYLANLPGTGSQTAAQAVTSLPSFAVGSPGLPSDMMAQVHQNEIIMDANTSQALQRYGIQVGVADNYGTSFSAGLQATNSILEMQVRYLSMIEQNTAAGNRIMQYGFSRLIAPAEQTAADTAEIKRKTRQAA